MSVRLIRSGESFAFGFTCNGDCGRPEIVALVLPGGWEALPSPEGLLHRCPSCRFAQLVEPLLEDLGWRRAT